jgi:ATPase complex subunit ATP10
MSFSSRPKLLCLLCQSRSFSTASCRRLAEKPQKKPAEAATPPPKPAKYIPPSPLENAPRGYGKRFETFTPVPLPRPIGMPYPPEPGQNTGLDFRTIRQRRDDFVNWDKHLKKREQLYVTIPFFIHPFHKSNLSLFPCSISTEEASPTDSPA